MSGVLPENADVPFTEPWELRAFALAVTAHREGRYDWEVFQRELAAAVRRREDAMAAGTEDHWDYYACWLEALETVLGGLGVDAAVTSERAATILATPRDLEHQRARREPVAVDPAR